MLRDTVVTTMLQLSLRDTDASKHLREIFFNIVCSAVNNSQIFNKNVPTKDTRNKMKRIKSKFLNTERFVWYFENDTQPLFWCMISKEIQTDDNYNNFNDNCTNDYTNMNRNFVIRANFIIRMKIHVHSNLNY